MKARHKLVLWVLVLYLAVLGVAAALGVVLGAGLPAADRETLGRILAERLPALVFVAGILLFVCAAAVKWLFAQYVTAVRALAEQTTVVAGANEALRVSTGGAREVAEAAAAINRLAEAHHALRRDFEQRARESGAQLGEERNRLAALMSELSEGVLVCNAEGRILLYNEQARALFGAARLARLVGLGRSVFTLVDREQIAHAMEKLQPKANASEAPPTTRFVAATAAGRLLRVKAAPFLDSGGEAAGVVLALEDVTGLLGQETTRRALLRVLAADVRAPVANIRAAAENLTSFPDMPPEGRARFVAIVAMESQGLTQKLNEALRDYADALKANLTLEDMRVLDLLEVARQRIEATLGVPTELIDVDETLWIRVDSFAFVQALAFLAARLRENFGVRALRLSAHKEGALAELDLGWAGASVAREALQAWESAPMQIGSEGARSACATCSNATGAKSGCRPKARAAPSSVSWCRPRRLRRWRCARRPRRWKAARSTMTSTCSAAVAPPRRSRSAGSSSLPIRRSIRKPPGWSPRPATKSSASARCASSTGAC